MMKPTKKWICNLKKSKDLFIQEAPGNFHHFVYIGSSGTQNMQKFFPTTFSFIVTCYAHKYFYYVYDINDMLKVAKEFIHQALKEKEYIYDLFESWKKIKLKFDKICHELNYFELKKFNSIQLKEQYLLFTNNYLDLFGFALITDATGYYLEKELSDFFDHNLSITDKNILFAPIYESFFSREKYDLSKIILRFEEIGFSELKKLILQHKENYFWIRNNYLNSKELSEDYFWDKIKKNLSKKNELQKYVQSYFDKLTKNKYFKEQLMQKLSLPDEIKRLIEINDLHGHWQDLRKEINLKANHQINLFLQVVSEKFNLNYHHLALLTLNEFVALLNKEKLDWIKIKDREKGCSVIYNNKQEVLITSHQQFKEIKSYLDKFLTKDDLTTFYGTGVSLGKIQGRAKIVNDPEKVNFTRGEILVTSMTRPEFVPIMEKASAVITNEGGMTCHAAIIAREFAIPCIVGTKIATTALNDGDLIEVDAEKGFIKILEKA